MFKRALKLFVPQVSKKNGGDVLPVAKIPSSDSKRNVFPPAVATTTNSNNNGVPSISSVSPAALSSSSGIGSTVDASPAEVNCNGHNYVNHVTAEVSYHLSSICACKSRLSVD